jgi:hypothetical protein
MASPVDSGAKISNVLTAIYKEELALLDKPRAALTSVIKVDLSDEAFILYRSDSPDTPNYRALTKEQSNHIRALAAANNMPELEKVAHELLKNALSVPQHIFFSLPFKGEPGAVLNEIDFNSIYKGKNIEKMGKCFQVIKVLEKDALNLVFQSMPEEGPITGKTISTDDIYTRIINCYNGAGEMIKGGEFTQRTNADGKTVLAFIPSFKFWSFDPLVYEIQEKILAHGAKKLSAQCVKGKECEKLLEGSTKDVEEAKR